MLAGCGATAETGNHSSPDARPTTEVSASPSSKATLAPVQPTAPTATFRPKELIPSPAESTSEMPNIISIMTDDMSADDLKYMPLTQKYIFDKGATFENYFVNISLCCPSRASNLTGMQANNTGIVRNSYPDGYQGFHNSGLENRTYGRWLDTAGYETSFMGKLLNGYPYAEDSPSHSVPWKHIPKGWDHWMVPVEGSAYFQRNFTMNKDGEKVSYHGDDSRNYLGNVLARHAVKQIIHAKRPLLQNIWTYSPHNPAAADPRDEEKFPHLRIPRTPDFNEKDVSDKPAYVRNSPRLTHKEIHKLDEMNRQRKQSLQSVDRMVGELHHALKHEGMLKNTYILFTSDNGWHMGQHRSGAGKNMPWDTDFHLPLGIRGPGIKPGTKVNEVVGNTDIAPTILDMAHQPMKKQIDGRSVLPLAQGEKIADWRDYYFAQRGMLDKYAKWGTLSEPGTKDEHQNEKKVPAFRAVFSEEWRYIQYDTGEEELYNIKNDPYEVKNLMAQKRLSTKQKQVHEEMKTALDHLKDCKGAEECSTAR
jgi:N-acetylglucosamine-6-sulfatase